MTEVFLGVFWAALSFAIFAWGSTYAETAIVDRCALTQQIVIDKRVFTCVEVKK